MDMYYIPPKKPIERLIRPLEGIQPKIPLTPKNTKPIKERRAKIVVPPKSYREKYGMSLKYLERERGKLMRARIARKKAATMSHS